jgi:hypothetical protein
MNPMKDRSVSRTKATVAPDGAVSGTTWLEVHGAQDAVLRTTLSFLPTQMLPQMAKQMLSANGQSGDATITLTDFRNFANSNLISVAFNTPARVNLPGPGALTSNFGPQSSTAKSFVTSVLQIERKLDFPCPTASSEDALELVLAPGMKITAMPAAASIDSPYGRFTTSYDVKDGTLLVTEKLALQRPRTVCTAADHTELRKFATAIDRELRKQILYQ